MHFNMPVTLREKRRSLHLGSTGKFSELAKEVAMRPQSWYLASGNIDLDPYTSVRKIFYEFPKKAFYGDHGNEAAKDEIISNTHTNTTQDCINKERETELKNSFINLSGKIPSPVPSHRSLKTENDNNNNNNNSLSSTAKSKSTILNKLSPKGSDLKEESSSYADFYVPNATKISHNFLRRSHHKRKNIENYKSGHSDNDDAISVTSYISATSCKLITNHRSCDFSKLKNLDRFSQKLGSDNVFISDADISPTNSHGSSCRSKSPPPKSPVTNATNDSTENPIMERFLRDANEDICQGVYPTADDSVLLPHENIISTLKLANKEKFIPWNKRISFVDAKLIENPPDLKASLNNRRNSKRFASLRFYKTNKDENNEKFNPHRRLSYGCETTTIRSNRGFTSLRRHHSESGTTSRKSKMSSTLSLYRQDSGSLARDVLNRSLRRKTRKLEAREFFQGYQDKLREGTFSVETESNDCKTTSSLCGVYDYISRAFEAKLLGKTYQQLYYIRSRLTLKAQKTNFLCDGYFGCGGEVQSQNSHLI